MDKIKALGARILKINFIPHAILLHLMIIPLVARYQLPNNDIFDLNIIIKYSYVDFLRFDKIVPMTYYS